MHCLRRANGIALTWGHTRLSETDFRLITQESPRFICGECQTLEINPDNQGEDKGSITRDYVEKVIRDRFKAEDITNASISINNLWNYDGVKIYDRSLEH